jgi:ABC-type branched-subunit amino acid transport system ATPase component
MFDGRDVTGLRADQVARLGMARTFQSTTLFDTATVLDNLIVGHRLRTRSGLLDVVLGTGRLKEEERICREKARAALDFVGLGTWRTASRATSRRKSASASRSRWRCRPTRPCCCWTNPRAA